MIIRLVRAGVWLFVRIDGKGRTVTAMFFGIEPEHRAVVIRRESE
jgi:hypothetical protein